MPFRRPAPRTDSGIALISVLLLLMLASAMLAGVASLTMTDARLRSDDRVQSRAFYAAYGAMEKMTADLGNLFSSNFAPTAAQVDALEANPPAMPGVQFLDQNGNPGYNIDFTQAGGWPVTNARQIQTGSFAGLQGLMTEYTLSTTAQILSGGNFAGEVALQRRMQTVAIPIFQFGVFSNTDVAFHANGNFNFGGRVHTNGNLFLAASSTGGISTLTLQDKVTAVGEVIRTNLPNGWPINDPGASYQGVINMAQAPGTFRPLAANEGSLVGNVGSAQNEPTWTNLSLSTYNGYIRSGRTGVAPLVLPFVKLGATPMDLIRRGVTGESPLILAQRYYEQASLRVLLSDTAADITNLPGITPAPPVAVGTLADLQANGYTGTIPLALSGNDASTLGGPGSRLIGGFIKIELQRPNRTWQDVTMEILNLGFTGRNPAAVCNDPSPDAVIRIQRVRNAPATPNVCGMLAGPPNNYSVTATDYWANVLYDAREGLRRQNVKPLGGSDMYLGGVMHYVELDANNLRRWFQGLIGVSGPGAINITGYTVYFSDRRGNRDGMNRETGEYGSEDFVNPGSPNPTDGPGNNAIDQGEDVNANGQLDTYGQAPPATLLANIPGAVPAVTPWTNLATLVGSPATAAQSSPALLFRRALKLTNGSLGNIIAPGLTVVAENPVYIQGNWNADATCGMAFAGCLGGGVATSVIADAVTLLSNSWNDVKSFTSGQPVALPPVPGQQTTPNSLPDLSRQWPNDPAQRPATETWYRVAVLAGKGIPFPFAGGADQSFGADGGVHNFLRMLEKWTGQTIHYKGSMANFFYSQQATGIFKCCVASTPYAQPAIRDYSFDLNFLTPALLPPLSPMFRDVNTTGFTQLVN